VSSGIGLATNDQIALLFSAPNLKIAVFADDKMVIMQGPSHPDIFKTPQTTLQTIGDWCKEHKLQISKDKSALMPMFARKREEFKRQPTRVARGIKIVWSNVRQQVGLVSPHSGPGKQVAAYPQ